MLLRGVRHESTCIGEYRLVKKIQKKEWYKDINPCDPLLCVKIPIINQQSLLVVGRKTFLVSMSWGRQAHSFVEAWGSWANASLKVWHIWGVSCQCDVSTRPCEKGWINHQSSSAKTAWMRIENQGKTHGLQGILRTLHILQTYSPSSGECFLLWCFLLRTNTHFLHGSQ